MSFNIEQDVKDNRVITQRNIATIDLSFIFFSYPSYFTGTEMLLQAEYSEEEEASLSVAYRMLPS